MNLFDRLSELLGSSPRPRATEEQLLLEMATHLDQARFCTALAIAVERRFGPALSADEVRRALRDLEARLAEARFQHELSEAERLATLARRDVCAPECDTIRSAFDEVERRLRHRRH
jgi:hypothetical protein